MWKTTLSRLITPVLQAEQFNLQQLRTTFVVKRRWPPHLHKANRSPRPLRGRHYVYDLIKDTTIEKQPDIEVVLVTYVDGYGNIGDKVSVKPTVAYNSLLLPGLAVYATPENVEKYANQSVDKEKDVVHSSAFAQRTMNVMSRLTLAIIMNKDVPWTLEPWHVKASFRKAGYHVAEDAIQLPNKPITGPDLSLQDKEFYVTVTINNLEQFQVRCRIHHWSTKIIDRLPYEFEHWKRSVEPLFPEDEAILAALPPKYNTTTSIKK